MPGTPPADAPRLVLIDGYSLLFRAFYGTRFLSTSDGRPTNALFGFVGMLFQLLQDFKPQAMVVALDAPGKTFRHADYPEYKGTRRETPSELDVQLAESRRLIQAFGIPTIELTGYEADDVIGTLSQQAEANGYITRIVTGDLDSLQLVDDWVHVVTTQRGVTEVKVYDPGAVQERYGFGPELIPDYKALVGDTSDNIPGVPGVGDKTASLLIQKYGTIEAIINQMDEIEEKFRKKLAPQEAQMHHSKWLATIIRDAPISYDFAAYQVTPELLELARAEMTSLEFRSYAKRIDQILAPYMIAGSATVITVATESIEAHLGDRPALGDDLNHWVENRPFAVVPAPGVAQASLLDEEVIDEMYVAVGNDVRRTTRADALRLIKSRPEQWVGHDTKPLHREANAFGAHARFDATLAAYVLQSGRTGYDLGDLIQGYLDVSTPTKPQQQAVGLLRLESVMRERLAAEGQEDVFQTIELPLAPILAEMEAAGIGLDTNHLREMSKQLEIAIDASATRVYELAGASFNISSPKQIGEIMFERMAIPGGKKTKTGWATGAEILGEMAAEHPIAGEILTFRELSKLKGTYTDALPKLVANDGRIHTTFNQTVAATGRLSSNEPNIQNIPIRTELGRQIRGAFVAAPGQRLGSFDYSQIELRILAHMCHDEALVNAFRQRIDVHTVTAALMFHIDNEQVTKEQRRLAKLLNYAVLYGVTDFGLANQLGPGFSVSDAKGLITQYNQRFPSVKAFTESVVEEARAKGFTVTLRGRRRTFADIHAGNRNARQYAERQAINAPIQGTAADMIKLAMLEVHRMIKGTGTRMLLQVHDELVFEGPDGLNGLTEPIRVAMEQALPLNVPVEVDAKVGENWLKMTPILPGA